MESFYIYQTRRPSHKFVRNFVPILAAFVVYIVFFLCCLLARYGQRVGGQHVPLRRTPKSKLQLAPFYNFTATVSIVLKHFCLDWINNLFAGFLLRMLSTFPALVANGEQSTKLKLKKSYLRSTMEGDSWLVILLVENYVNSKIDLSSGIFNWRVL